MLEYRVTGLGGRDDIIRLKKKRTSATTIGKGEGEDVA